MKKIITCLCLGMVLLLGACGGSKHDNSKFAGSFTDEFGNKFVVTLAELTDALQVDVCIVESSGADFIHAVIGDDM